MTMKEFVAKISAYYGLSYPEGQRDDLVEYLRSCSETRLDLLYKAVIKAHSSKWKTLPDIAIFESKEVAHEVERLFEQAHLELEDQRRRKEAATMLEERYATRDEVADFLATWERRMREKAGEGK